MGMSVLIVAALLASAPAPKEAPEVEASVKKIKELQKERVAVLKKAAEVSSKLAQAARLEISEALEDRMTLLKAELEVAEKESDRVALYTKALDDLKVFAEVARARFEAGRGNELAVHKVEARRLETEIARERAKIKEAREKK